MRYILAMVGFFFLLTQNVCHSETPRVISADLKRMDCALLQHEAATYVRHLNQPPTKNDEELSILLDQRGIDLLQPIRKKLADVEYARTRWSNLKTRATETISANNEAHMLATIESANKCFEALPQY